MINLINQSSFGLVVINDSLKKKNSIPKYNQKFCILLQ